MKTFLMLAVVASMLPACASKKKLNHAMLEKYPKCYHANPKISNACIAKNEAGEEVTALQLENTAYPGQYR